MNVVKYAKKFISLKSGDISYKQNALDYKSLHRNPISIKHKISKTGLDKSVRLTAYRIDTMKKQNFNLYIKKV